MSEKITSYFDDTKVTTRGLELLTKLIATGKPLHFTRAVISDKISDGDNVNMTEVTNIIPSHTTGEDETSATVDLMITGSGGEDVYMRVRIQNGDTDFVLRKIVIMAEDGDKNEIPYAYTCDRSEHAMPFPSITRGKRISSTVDIAFFVSGMESVTANVTLVPEVGREEYSRHIRESLGKRVVSDQDYSGTNIYCIPPSFIENMPTEDCIFVIVKDTYEYGSGVSDLALYTYDLETGIRYWATQDSYFNISEITKSDWHAFR